MKFVTKKDIAISILLFSLSSVSLEFFIFLSDINALSPEIELHEILGGNVGATIALVCAQILFIPSSLVAIVIDKIFPRIDHVNLIPVVGGFLAVDIYFLTLGIVKKIKTKNFLNTKK